MKVLFVGDVHNHYYIFKDIDRLDKEYNFDRIIFTGDYVDDWYTTNRESAETLDELFELKSSNPSKYTMCIGNHELSYMGFPCSGHQYELEETIIHRLRDNINLLDLYAEVELEKDKIWICSHSGITNDFAYNELDRYGDNCIGVLREMNKDIKSSLPILQKCSYYRGGDSPYSSFLWADKREMYSIFENSENLVIPYQIVGHSPIKTISSANTKDNEVWFIDTHSTYRDGSEFGDKSYLMWDDTKFEILY